MSVKKPTATQVAIETAVREMLANATAPLGVTEMAAALTADKFKKLGKTKRRQLVQNTVDHLARVKQVEVTKRAKKTGRLINVYLKASDAPADAPAEATEVPAETTEVEAPVTEEAVVEASAPLNAADFA